MKAIIFSAGLGTRFKPWTNAHPKALALVNGKSLLQRNVEYLQQYGIKEVIVNVHHFADQIISAVEKSNGWGSKIIISDESKEVLETGGGLLKASNLLQGSAPFITLNVDILTNLDLNKLLDFHLQHKPLITVCVTDRKTSRYLLFDEGSRMCGWKNTNTNEEKISIAKPGLKLMAYSGIAVFEPAIFPLIKQQGKFSLIETYLDLATSKTILGYEHTGDNLIDVGNPESIAVAEAMFI